jgi:N-acetyl-alpha-D-muramate 1-phosphate uridylyltransferase
MKAMILAAGLGERMRPLTNHTPKPLLPVAGVPLIERHIVRLAEAGFDQIVINISHLARKIVDFCGDGSRWGVAIQYSHEASPLETAGGIAQALPLLGEAPFLVVNGDVWTDFPFARMVAPLQSPQGQPCLLMIANRPHHPLGDFYLDDSGLLQHRQVDQAGLTYAGIGVFSASFFDGQPVEAAPLRPLLDKAIDRGQLHGLFYEGGWEDVGTPQRLAALNERESAR